MDRSRICLLMGLADSRKADGELGAATDLALHVDGAAVRLDDFARRCQAQSGAALARREKRTKYLGRHVRRHSSARVDQTQTHAVRFTRGLDRQLAAARS